MILLTMAQAMLERRTYSTSSDSTEESTAPSSDDISGLDFETIEEYIKKHTPSKENSTFIRFSFLDDQALSEIKHQYLPFLPIVYKPEQIHIKLTQEEKQQHKREYRKQYKLRPEIIKKKEQDRNDPVKRQMRKAYADREDVKARKQQLAKAKREYLQTLRQNPDSNYKEYIAKTVPPISRKRKRDEVATKGGESQTNSGGEK